MSWVMKERGSSEIAVTLTVEEGYVIGTMASWSELNHNHSCLGLVDAQSVNLMP